MQKHATSYSWGGFVPHAQRVVLEPDCSLCEQSGRVALRVLFWLHPKLGRK